MNFWRTSILPLVLAAAAFLGLCAPEAVAQPDACVFEHREATAPTWFGWSPAPAEDSTGQATLASSDADQDHFAPSKKRNRKCWRPERSVAVALVPVKSPAEAARPVFAARNHDIPSPAVSDLLFIVGGYTRLFQKG